MVSHEENALRRNAQNDDERKPKNGLSLEKDGLLFRYVRKYRLLQVDITKLSANLLRKRVEEAG